MKRFVDDIIHGINCECKTFYIVGGVPRDILLKHPINDVDIILPLTKDAPFFVKHSNRTIKKGIGTVLKKMFINGKRLNCEFSPLKKGNIEQDLKSRDLTINAITYKVNSDHQTYELYDPCGGINDLLHHKLRCYQKKNLVDDPIRMLRVFRFQALLNFDIDSHTSINIVQNKTKIHDAPYEMIYGELTKILKGDFCVRALRNMATSGLLSEIIPEIDSSIDFLHQDPYHHHESIFEHSLSVLHNCILKKLPLVYRLAAIFHDISKPSVFDGKHYIGHEKRGAQITRKILKRLRFPNHTIKTVSKIIKDHMLPLDSQKKFFEMRYNTSKEEFQNQIQFIEADKMSTNPLWNKTKAFHIFEMHMNKVKQYEECGFFDHLDELINGRLLLQYGLKQGPGFQQILDYLKQHFFKKPEKLSERKISTLLEQNLFFTGQYESFKFKELKMKRIREYIKGNVIVGLLDENIEIALKSGIFDFNYFSKGEFLNWEKENQKYCSLFF